MLSAYIKRIFKKDSSVCAGLRGPCILERKQERSKKERTRIPLCIKLRHFEFFFILFVLFYKRKLIIDELYDGG